MIADDLLTPVEVRLIALVSEAPSAAAADIAKQLRISERHLRRVMATERVRKALDEAARAGLREASSILGRGAVKAARALIAMAAGELPPTSARVQAARAVLDGASRMIDIIDLEARIVELEKERSTPWRGAPQ
jgi:hypothetical protein